MIKRDHHDLSISQQCRLVRLSRSAFYYTPVGVDSDTLAMMTEIDRVFTKYPFFGSRQSCQWLRHWSERPLATPICAGKEAIYLEEITDGFQARRVVKDWIAFYNTNLPHSALDRRTPDEAYWDGREKQKTA